MTLDALLAALPTDTAWSAPFSSAEVAKIERVAGLVAPPLLRDLWLRHGHAEVATRGGPVRFHDAPMLADVADNLRDHDHAGLLPFAHEGGARDFVVDLTDLLGEGVGAVFLVDQSALDRELAVLVARDLTAFLHALADDSLDLRGPNLGARWTARRLADPAFRPALPGLDLADAAIDRLHFRSDVPARLTPRRDLDVAGVPCAAGLAVDLDAHAHVIHAFLARDHEIAGVLCQARTWVAVIAGGLRRFTPVAPFEHAGLTLRAGCEVTLPDERLGVWWGTLAEPRELGGLPCAAERVCVHIDGSVRDATLARAATVDGVDLPAGTRFERLGDALFEVRLPVPAVLLGREVPAGKHYLHTLRGA